MKLVMQGPLPKSSAPTTQRRLANRALRLGAASLTSAFALLACSLTTNLDFVGSAGPKPKGTGGSSNAGAGGDAPGMGGTGAAGGTTLNFAGTSGNAGESGLSGASGFAGASGSTGKAPNACDDSCVGRGICSGDSCLCTSGALACEGSCLEPIEQAGYCGRCGNTCGGDQSCVDGACHCLDAGNTACGSGCFDLSSDVGHCGRCENACTNGQLCIKGVCRSSPCDGLCQNPESVDEAADGFRIPNLGTAERCLAVSGYQPTETDARIVCWSFDAARTLQVNGTSVECVSNEGTSLSRDSHGWYCLQVSAGAWGYAGLLLPKF